MNLLKARVDAVDATAVKVSSADLGELVLPGAFRQIHLGDEITVGMRPHHMTLKGPNPITGIVRVVERLGNETLTVLALPSGQEVVAALPGETSVSTGETLSVSLQPERANLFLSSGVAA